MKYFNKIICLNPVAVQGRQLKDIIFFNEDGIQFKANRGWLESKSYPRRITMEDINIDYDEVLKVKRKEVFDKEKVYLMNAKAEYFEREKYYTIYIHIDFITYDESAKYYDNSMNHCYKEYYCAIDGQTFIIHERIEESLQNEVSEIKTEFDELKKKMDLMNVKDDLRSIFSEFENVQNKYDKKQHEILASGYTLAR